MTEWRRANLKFADRDEGIPTRPMRLRDGWVDVLIEDEDFDFIKSYPQHRVDFIQWVEGGNSREEAPDRSTIGETRRLARWVASQPWEELSDEGEVVGGTYEFDADLLIEDLLAMPRGEDLRFTRFIDVFGRGLYTVELEIHKEERGGPTGDTLIPFDEEHPIMVRCGECGTIFSANDLPEDEDDWAVLDGERVPVVTAACPRCSEGVEA